METSIRLGCLNHGPLGVHRPDQVASVMTRHIAQVGRCGLDRSIDLVTATRAVWHAMDSTDGRYHYGTFDLNRVKTF